VGGLERTEPALILAAAAAGSAVVWLLPWQVALFALELRLRWKRSQC